MDYGKESIRTGRANPNLAGTNTVFSNYGVAGGTPNSFSTNRNRLQSPTGETRPLVVECKLYLDVLRSVWRQR